MTDTSESDRDLLSALRSLIARRNAAAEAFELFKQDAVMAHEPEVDQTPIINSDEAADTAADQVDTITAQIQALLRTTSDGALFAAYDETDGAIGNLEAEALIGEIKRRGLDQNRARTPAR